MNSEIGRRLGRFAQLVCQTADRLGQGAVGIHLEVHEIDLLVRHLLRVTDVDHHAARAGGDEQFIGRDAEDDAAGSDGDRQHFGQLPDIRPAQVECAIGNRDAYAGISHRADESAIAGYRAHVYLALRADAVAHGDQGERKAGGFGWRETQDEVIRESQAYLFAQHAMLGTGDLERRRFRHLQLPSPP